MQRCKSIVGQVAAAATTRDLSLSEEEDETMKESETATTTKRPPTRTATLTQRYDNLYDNQPDDAMRFIARSELIVAPSALSPIEPLNAAS